MERIAAAPSAESRRRASLIATSAIALVFLVVSIIFAADTQWYFVFKMIHVGAAVVWVGGGLFITMCAVLAELANDDDQLLQIGYWAEHGAVVRVCRARNRALDRRPPAQPCATCR